MVRCAGDMPAIDDLIDYLASSPTPFHAVESARSRLERGGFRRLSLRQSFDDLAPGRYFVDEGHTNLFAFVVPKIVKGFRLVGAHTDSPNLRLKPKPAYTKEGYLQLGVEVYGGALLNSWLDRDLSVAGRIVVRDGDGVRSVLVRVDRVLARIPQLAIHLDRDVNEKGVQLNRQEHLPPVVGLAGDGAEGVLELVRREAGVDKDLVLAEDLMLFDTLRPALGGAREEFLFSARLDNLAMCHASVSALLDAIEREPGAIDAEGLVPIAALFDHEEIGSESVNGAHSGALPRLLERISRGRGASDDDHARTLAASLCVSADMAHAIHPNYPDRHEARHRPVLNGGPVIKVNAQQRYATSAVTAALFAELGRKVDAPIQHYAHRTDLPCGSTIGPIASTLLGIRTVDVGNPMLSMHSCREMAGTKDPETMTRVLAAFYAARDPEA